MKKQLLAIAIIAAGIANAQTFTQPFTSATGVGLPTGWLQNNVDAKIVANTATMNSYSFTTNAWVTRNVSTSTDPITAAHGRVAVSTSYYTPAGTSNDWLITPSFTVPANGVLSWAATAIDPNYPDGYLVKISTTGTLTTDFSTTLLTVPAESTTWNNRSINLNTYAGQTVRIAFVNNSNDMYLLFLDDVNLIVPAANDLNVVSATPTGLSRWGTVGSTKTITQTVKNNGYNTVTGFTAHYSDGIVNETKTVTGLNLSYGQSTVVTFTAPYTIAGPSQATVKVWADLTGDGTHANDTIITHPTGYAFTPNHKVVFEEGTGTWCGWCPRGTVYMDSMHLVNPNSTALIAVHNSDPMTVTAYDAGIGTLISGYPTALCGRAIEELDPSDMFTSYATHLNDFGLANLTVVPSFNATTRVASILVNTNISSTFDNNNSNNDYRIAVVFTEDGVTGTTSTYAQTNYYSSSSNNLALKGAGRNWQTSANPVPAAQMHYDFVARTIVGGFSGQANSLPSSLVSGTTYTSNAFNYTVPAAYNVNKMNVHALLIDAKTNEIYNANTAPLTTVVTGIKSVSTEKIEMAVYPNPAKNNATIALSLDKTETVTVNVLSVMGQVVFTQTLNLSAGNQTIALDCENWASGIYNVNVATNNGNVSSKLNIVK